jgi:hypothetical protein
VQADNAFAFEGSFQLAKSAPRTQLLTLLLDATSGAASDDALDVLQWAAASLRGMEGCDEAKARECEDLLLRTVSCDFSERAAALATLPAPLLGRLLRCDEVNTQTEEQTLLALAPWLDAPARAAEEVAEALQGLRWAWLPARLVMRLLAEGGALAKFAEAGRDGSVSRKDLGRLFTTTLAFHSSNKRRLSHKPLLLHSIFFSLTIPKLSVTAMRSPRPSRSET